MVAALPRVESTSPVEDDKTEARAHSWKMRECNIGRAMHIAVKQRRAAKNIKNGKQDKHEIEKDE